ncbi:MAG: hypothetical protein JO096_11400 [Alphaproteobacteria bacterium]|nr:hypothetical protein [Alphaproteobacteria bacterium]
MRTVFARLAVAGLLGSFALSAHGQGLPPGSYQQSCRDFRIEGSNLTAVCRRSHGRGEQLTALNVSHCVGDIGNNNGQLVCNGGRPAAPLPPRQGPGPGYPGPGYSGPGYSPGPGYAGPGYGPPPRYTEDYRARCEGLRHEEHELRDRLAYTPYGEEREQLQYRLGRIQAERQQCWRR